MYTPAASDVLESKARYTSDWEVRHGNCYRDIEPARGLSIRYDRLAKSTGRTKTFYMTEALAAEIDRLEYEYGLLKKVEDYRAGRLETVTLDELEESLGLAD